LKASVNRFPLILRSNGLSKASDGDKLTSRSHGLKNDEYDIKKLLQVLVY